MVKIISHSVVAAGLVAAVALTACTEAPRELSLQLLAREQSTVNGYLVITTGVVQSFDDPLHYWLEDSWLEDSAPNRVALHPNDAVADYVGEYVEVEGRFHADRERGRRIEVVEIRRAERT